MDKLREYQNLIYSELIEGLKKGLQSEGKELVNAFRILPSVLRFCDEKEELLDLAFENIYKLVSTEKLRFYKQAYRALFKPKDKKILKDILEEENEEISE